MRKSIIALVSLTLILLTAVPLTAAPLTPSVSPLPAITMAPAALQQRLSQSKPDVRSKSEAAVKKLSPDLREAAQDAEQQPVIVTALVAKGIDVSRFMLRSVTSKPLGDIQWTSGEIAPGNLIKLASAPGVLSVTSINTFQPDFAPGVDELPSRQPRLEPSEAQAVLREQGRAALFQKAQSVGVLSRARQALPPEGIPTDAAPTDAAPEDAAPTEAAPTDAAPTDAAPEAPVPDDDPSETVKVRDIHGSTAAQRKGYRGDGVVVSVVDTGVDFANPDLTGTQARVPSGPYAG